MSVVGVLSGGPGQSDNGIRLDADEAAGLSNAIALGQVVEDGDGGFIGESATIQGRALAFGEAGAAGVAVAWAKLFVLAVAAADRAGRDRRRSGAGSERVHTSYVESSTMVQLACDTTEMFP